MTGVPAYKGIVSVKETRNMRVLVTGGQGMLGRTISDAMADVEVIPADKDEADILDENGFEDAL